MFCISILGEKKLSKDYCVLYLNVSFTYFENYIQEQCIRGDNEIVCLCLTYTRVINCNNFTLNWCGKNCFVFMNEGFLVV